MKQNFWTTTFGNVGFWTGYMENLPEARLEFLLSLAKQILLLGEQYGVLHIEKFNNVIMKSHDDYLEHTAKIAENDGYFPWFTFQRPIDDEKSYVTRICYYSKDGTLREDSVDNMGALLADLRPNDVNTYSIHRYMRAVRPITIEGQLVPCKNEGIKKFVDWEFHFNIYLETDIWYPYVLGYLETDRMPRQLYDNRELALCHTPRLNSFLVAVRRIILDLGGGWFFDKEGSSARDPYYERLTEVGISLNGL